MMGNQLFSGGLFLLIVGYFMGYLRSFVSFLLEYTMRHFFIEVELKNGEDAHRWLVTYVRSVLSNHLNKLLCQKSNKIVHTFTGARYRRTRSSFP